MSQENSGSQLGLREERIRHFSVRNEHHNQTSTDAQEQQDPPSKETPYDIT